MAKIPPARAGDTRDMGSIPGGGRSPGKGNSSPLSILAWTIPWTGKLVGYSPWGRKELDMTEHSLTHTSGCILRASCD